MGVAGTTSRSAVSTFSVVGVKLFFFVELDPGLTLTTPTLVDVTAAPTLDVTAAAPLARPFMPAAKPLVAAAESG